MEKNDGIYESTVSMYENTIKEMEERGCSEDEIDAVRDALESFIGAVEYETVENKEELNLSKAAEFKLAESSPFEPIKSNMFILRVGNIPIWLPQYVCRNDEVNELTILFYESEQFSPFDYLNDNGTFDEIKIEFLNRVGEIIRVETFSNAKLSVKSLTSLSYKDDTPMGTYATFKYDKHGITTSKKERNISETEVEDCEEEDFDYYDDYDYEEEKADSFGDYQEEHCKEPETAPKIRHIKVRDGFRK